MSTATRAGDPGAVTPAQVLAGLLLAVVVLWLLAPFAGNDPPARLGPVTAKVAAARAL